MTIDPNRYSRTNLTTQLLSSFLFGLAALVTTSHLTPHYTTDARRFLPSPTLTAPTDAQVSVSDYQIQHPMVTP